jgi:methylenetetrahydrofolate dehydrogenase (NADP+)/methenyltetrahydrofolate cyclohydrolase
MEKMYGTELAEKINKETAATIKKDKLELRLDVIYIGDNLASEKYINKKREAAEKVGIEFRLWKLERPVSTADILSLTKKLNSDNEVTGILLQLPIPDEYDLNQILESIDPTKDVDGLSPVNMGKLMKGIPGLFPATPEGVIKLLKYYKIDLVGKNVTIIGRSNLVGKPLAQMFINEDSTVTIANGKTKSLREVAMNADILVSATGKPKIITKEIVRPGCVVVDVGTSIIDGKIVGDVDIEGVSEIASLVTPVPGGVGPMTVAMLLSNVIKAHKLRGDK